MDTILYLIIGLIVGAGLGWLLASRSKAGASPDGQIALADAKARVELLQQQVTQLETDRASREARERQENKLLQELAPVKENLTKMQEAVSKMETERLTQFTTLNEAIKQAVESDASLRRETQMLSNALSSNTMRGVWGEAQLRKLVELAGLVKHADFTEQTTNTTGRADMIINLPGGKSLAIDSKVPYNSYQEASQISELATGAEGERRKQLMQAHVKAVKSHIDALAGKAYWTGLEASPDFVICFIPSESLLSAALSEDATLLEYAFGKNVAVASPVSLFSVLKTINFIWRQNVDENQVRSMIKLGRELYERVGIIAEKADKLGRSLVSTVKDYNSFVSSLESRMLVTARKLNNLDENELSNETIDSPLELDAGVTLPTISEMSEIEEKSAKKTDKN
jgi:DNA recombination protein RmuC